MLQLTASTGRPDRKDAMTRRLGCALTAGALLFSGWIPVEAQDRVADSGDLQFNVGFLQPPVAPWSRSLTGGTTTRTGPTNSSSDTTT